MFVPKKLAYGGSALTMKLGTLMYHDKCSSKQKLQVCKASCSHHDVTTRHYKLLIVGPLTMKLH